MRTPPNAGRGDWKLSFERKGRPATTSEDREAIHAFFTSELGEGLFGGDAEVIVDDYEILVIGSLPGGGDHPEAAAVEAFREQTRERRVAIAQQAEARFSRKVSWGVRVGGVVRLFTTTSVPVMTRLHMRQRQTLDTLVEAGVARSRSEALSWCVELVGRNETEWITKLRDALDAVVRARAEGPATTSAGEEPEER
jgi:hypothetical protein